MNLLRKLSGVEWNRLPSLCRGQGESKESSSRASSDLQVAGVISKGTDFQGLFWVALRWVHFCISSTLRILKFYIEALNGFKTVQIVSLTTVLSQGSILRETSGNGKGKWEAYSKDRKEGDKPTVVQVQLAGQTLGHIFSMASPNWQYVDWARIMPDTQQAPTCLSLLYCHPCFTSVFFQDK